MEEYRFALPPCLAALQGGPKRGLCESRAHRIGDESFLESGHLKPLPHLEIARISAAAWLAVQRLMADGYDLSRRDWKTAAWSGAMK